jgi:hypothetical protein
MDSVPKKPRWADIPDDAPLPQWPPPEPPVIVSKHGIKVRAVSRGWNCETVPPPLKQKPPVKDKAT